MPPWTTKMKTPRAVLVTPFDDRTFHRSPTRWSVQVEIGVNSSSGYRLGKLVKSLMLASAGPAARFFGVEAWRAKSAR